MQKKTLLIVLTMVVLLSAVRISCDQGSVSVSVSVSSYPERVRGGLSVFLLHRDNYTFLANSTMNFSDLGVLDSAIVTPLTVYETSWRLEVIHPKLDKVTSVVGEADSWIVDRGLIGRVSAGNYSDVYVILERTSLGYEAKISSPPSPYTLLFLDISKMRVELEFVCNETPHRELYTVEDFESPYDVSASIVLAFMVSNKTVTRDFYVRVEYDPQGECGVAVTESYILVRLNASKVNVSRGWLIVETPLPHPMLSWMKLNFVTVHVKSEKRLGLTSVYVYTYSVRVVVSDETGHDSAILTINGKVPRLIGGRLAVVLGRDELAGGTISVEFITRPSEGTPNFSPPPPRREDVALILDILVRSHISRLFRSGKDVREEFRLRRRVLVENVTFSTLMRSVVVELDRVSRVRVNLTETVPIMREAVSGIKVYATFPSALVVRVSAPYNVSGSLDLKHVVLGYVSHLSLTLGESWIHNIDSGDYIGRISILGQEKIIYLTLVAGVTKVAIDVKVETQKLFPQVFDIAFAVVVPALLLGFVGVRSAIMLDSALSSGEKLKLEVSLKDNLKKVLPTLMAGASLFGMMAVAVNVLEVPNTLDVAIAVTAVALICTLIALLFGMLMKVNLLNYDTSRLKLGPKDVWLYSILSNAVFIYLMFILLVYQNLLSCAVYLFFALGAMVYSTSVKRGPRFTFDIYKTILSLVVGVVSLVGIGWVTRLMLGSIVFFARVPFATGDVVSAVWVCVMAPVVEELIFRGAELTLTLPRDRRGNAIIASLINGAVFALFHIAVYQSQISAIVYLFAFGFICSIITLTTGSIIPAILIHMTNNTLAYFGI